MDAPTPRDAVSSPREGGSNEKKPGVRCQRGQERTRWEGGG